jgi:hypothetical protein
MKSCCAFIKVNTDVEEMCHVYILVCQVLSAVVVGPVLGDVLRANISRRRKRFAGNLRVNVFLWNHRR